MELSALPLVSALWFGILTSISPCPLATNIAATTYIGKQVDSRYGSVVAGLAYTLGRALAYIAVSFAVVAGLFSIPGVSMFLQQYMNRLLGPLLILVGLLLANVIPLRLPEMGLMNSGLASRLSRSGAPGAVFLGVLFALSFCPVSAALFFGSVIPLSLKYQSSIWLPLWFGIGTALPVMGFAFLLAYASRFAARFVQGLSLIERHLRRLTVAIFLLIGLYFTVSYTLQLSIFSSGSGF